MPERARFVASPGGPVLDLETKTTVPPASTPEQRRGPIVAELAVYETPGEAPVLLTIRATPDGLRYTRTTPRRP